MPGAAKEIHGDGNKSLPGEEEEGTRKSCKKIKHQSESHSHKERKSLKKSSSSSQKDDLYRKKRKGDMKLDEASRLQRRTRNLLIKMKLEQNLIDAYSGEGWKGQSREKIKPDTELQRAKEQILKCKLGIREVVRELDFLSSVGRIDDSVVAPDGSVHHEHIMCAKCKLLEAFPDNDIILCDGSCNRAFHQKCLDPPLTTENIPPGDEGWFCKYCKSKMEILEATNAHLGTHFPLDSNWQDIFKEEAVIPDGGVSLDPPDWPSDESDDDDYDPEKIENSRSTDLATSESQNSANSSSFSTLGSLEDDLIFLAGRDGAPDVFIGADSDESGDCEVTCGRRQRPSVDYIRLNDELFGKNTPISEDEDWGPTRLKRRRKESDAASALISPSENENNAEEKMHGSLEKIRRPLFRIPRHAVEQLRTVFSENELPSRTVRENLAKQLGLDFEKVNKWFKNTRYHALKVRKGVKGELGQSSSKSSKFEGLLETAGHVDFADDVSLKLLREKSKKRKLKGKNQRVIPVVEVDGEAEADMEKLCRLTDKIQRLRQVLDLLPNRKSKKSYMSTDNESRVILIPTAELKVKR